MATSGELLDLFRTEVADTAEPYLWSDEFFFGALDDAQRKFTRETDGIPDSTSAAVVEIDVVPDTEVYDLHPALIKIRSARRADNGRPVEVLNFEDMIARRWYFDGRKGPLSVLVTGMDTNKVRVWPVPNETITVKLSTYRMPLVTIADDQALEIEPQHHRHLLLWVKSLAYSVQDAETLNKSKAEEFEQKFLNYCAEAKKEQGRLRHKPRAVAYGGI